MGTKSYEIVVPGEMPTMNEIIDAAKSHYQAYHGIKRANAEKVAWASKKLPEMEKIRLKITWYRANRRTDPDNICAGIKFVLDGLVQAGVLKNDGWSEVESIQHDWQVDKERPRVEVQIEEVA